MLLIGAYRSTGDERSKNANLEDLKTFLINRPAIESVVIRAMNPTGGMELAGSHGAPMLTSTTVYHASWQKDNFWIRQVPGQFDEHFTLGTNTLFFLGRSGQTVWQAGSFYAIKAAMNNEELSSFLHPHSANAIVPIVSAAARMLRRFLDLGLVDVKTGTFQFHGNKFRVGLNRGVDAEGELLEERGQVTAIRFQIAGETKCLVSELQYSTNRFVPEFLPTKVIQKVYDSGNHMLNLSMQYEFVQLRCASKDLDAGFFLPDRFYMSGSNSTTAEMVYTNGVVFQKVGTNLVRVPDARKMHFPMSKRLFIGVAFGVVLLFSFLISRLQCSELTTKREKEIHEK